MLNVLAVAFLSFSLLNQTNPKMTGENPKDNDILSLGTGGSSKVPETNISFEEFEITSWREFLIGRHQMGKINLSTYMGFLPIDQLSDWYDSNALTDFTFTDSFTTITEETLSLTIKESSTFSSTFGIKAGLKGFEASSQFNVTNSYTLEGTVTYSFATHVTRTVQYSVQEDKLEGKTFSLCLAAHVFKLECETWQFDDYWWGDVEVDGSRKTFVSYLTLIPTITIMFADGGLLK